MPLTRPAGAGRDGVGAPGAAVIELRGAAVGYGDRPVVSDVDLRIARGEVVALVGPNGSGKTTIVRGILGLAPVVTGSVELFGVPAEQFHQRWLIGYVPQRHTVVGAVPSTVEEVVGSGRLPRKRLFSLTTRLDRAAVSQAIGVVGLGDRRRAPVSTLSGGQQRRVLIARALAAEPEVLVMDEPTAGVDAQNSESLTRTLARLVDHGLTLLVVTHDVRPLAPILTRVVAVAAGRVVADEPAARALAGGAGLGELGVPLYDHPGHDPHHGVAGDAVSDDANRTAVGGWLGVRGVDRGA